MSKTELASTLRNNAAVRSIVGDAIFSRVIWQGADVPAVTYQRVVRSPENHLNGPATLDRDRYQVNSWAMDEDQVDALAKAVRVALEAQNYMMDFEIDATYEADTRRYGIRQDYFHHQQR